MASDPYAALRGLSFTYNPGRDITGYGDNGEMYTQSAAQNGTAGWQLNGASGLADFSALNAGGFNSKYNAIQELPDGTLQLTVQRPGMHKYDTMEVYYGKGQDGQYQFLGAEDSRQQSGMSKFGKNLVEGGTFVGSVLGAAYLGAQGLEALSAAGGAAGAAAETAPVWNAALAESASGAAGYGASSLGAGGAAAGGAGVLSGVAGAQSAPVWNAALAESAAGTAGYGASSLGAGGAAAGGDWLATLGQYARPVISAAGTVFNNSGLLSLIGAGVSNWNMEKIASDNREWQSAEAEKARQAQLAKEAATRARQAPVSVASPTINVRRGVLNAGG